MPLSFQMLPEQPAQELLDAAGLADRLGYSACYSADEIDAANACNAAVGEFLSDV